MSGTYPAASESGENHSRIARLSISALGRAVIVCDGASEHHDESGLTFRAAKWNDPNPNEISKYYTLQQFTRPAGSFSYSLKVFRNGQEVEWYDFQDGLAHVTNRKDRSGRRLTIEEHKANYARAAKYLVSTLIEWGYAPPLAELSAPLAHADIAGCVDDFSTTENQAFLELVATLDSKNP